MSATTTRSGDAANTWTQTTIGETPNSVSISTNSKGQAQIDVKLYFATPDEMQALSGDYLHNIIWSVKERLTELGIPMAGQEGR